MALTEFEQRIIDEFNKFDEVSAKRHGVKADNSTDNTDALFALGQTFAHTQDNPRNRRTTIIHLSERGITRGHLPDFLGIVWASGSLYPPTTGAYKHLVYPSDPTWSRSTAGGGAHRGGLRDINICGEKGGWGNTPSQWIKPLPTGLTVTAQTGGSLPAGDYAYHIAYKTSFGIGEAHQDVHVWGVPANGSAKLTWTNTASDAEIVVFGRAMWDRDARGILATLPAGTSTWTDTGAATPSGIRPLAFDLTAPSVHLVGAARIFDNVHINDVEGTGFASEWWHQSIPNEGWYSSMETLGGKVRIENTGGPGFVWEGPHDSHFFDIFVNGAGSGTGSGDAELRNAFHANGGGPLLVDRLHVWGTHRYGWAMDTACRIASGSSEGARYAQISMTSDQAVITGSVDVFPGRNYSVGGVVGFQAGRPAINGGNAATTGIPFYASRLQIRDYSAVPTTGDGSDGSVPGVPIDLQYAGTGHVDARVLAHTAGPIVNGLDPLKHDVEVTNSWYPASSSIAHVVSHIIQDPRTITLWANSLGTTTWASMPAAVTELLGKTTARTKVDLRGYTQARLTVGMGATAGNAGSGLAVQYSTDQSTWKYLDEATLSVGTTGPSAAISTATTASAGAWVNLATGAKADVWLRVVGTTGNGTISPIIGTINLHLK